MEKLLLTTFNPLTQTSWKTTEIDTFIKKYQNAVSELKSDRSGILKIFDLLYLTGKFKGEKASEKVQTVLLSAGTWFNFYFFDKRIHDPQRRTLY